ncbi:MAG: substrate-binding domain-containing protein [Candidatus Sulfotelmatobacter sp.]
MRKPKILISLTTLDNDYQIEQAADAHDAALRLGVELQFVYADNDPIAQSQQLLKIIQSSSESRFDAIIVEPVGGAGLPRVARAAAQAGIGWVVVNWDVAYLEELRREFSVPLFAVTSDHREIGRIHGRQLAKLMPHRGSVLYVQGPSHSPPAQQRSSGLYETKPEHIDLKVLRANWTSESAIRAINCWLRLSFFREIPLCGVLAQDDSMALGSREALQGEYDAERWLRLPFIGCDGLWKTGQVWVRRGLLAATVIVPPNTSLALELVVKQIRDGLSVPIRTLTTPQSYPPLETLSATRPDALQRVQQTHKLSETSR